MGRMGDGRDGGWGSGGWGDGGMGRSLEFLPGWSRSLEAKFPNFMPPCKSNCDLGHFSGRKTSAGWPAGGTSRENRARAEAVSQHPDGQGWPLEPGSRNTSKANTRMIRLDLDPPSLQAAFPGPKKGDCPWAHYAPSPPSRAHTP